MICGGIYYRIWTDNNNPPANPWTMGREFAGYSVLGGCDFCSARIDIHHSLIVRRFGGWALGGCYSLSIHGNSSFYTLGRHLLYNTEILSAMVGIPSPGASSFSEGSASEPWTVSLFRPRHRKSPRGYLLGRLNSEPSKGKPRRQARLTQLVCFIRCER